VNPFAQFILPRIHADIALIGVSGVEAEHGVTNVNVAEAEMKALFVRAARRRVVLADSSKVGKVALARFADLVEIDLLITDLGADEADIAAIRAKGLEVKLV
jgi:DeoR family transcriptional regulator of aga operon